MALAYDTSEGMSAGYPSSQIVPPCDAIAPPCASVPPPSAPPRILKSARALRVHASRYSVTAEDRMMHVGPPLVVVMSDHHKLSF